MVLIKRFPTSEIRKLCDGIKNILKSSEISKLSKTNKVR